MTLPLLVALALLTSILSGLLGMAGGLVLMAACTALLSVPAAMTFHGGTQLVANGFRALVLRGHVRWTTVAAHAGGSLVAAGLLRVVAFTPELPVVLIGIGLVPFIAAVLPRSRWLDASRPLPAFACGLLTCGVQLVAGVAGPLLDAFFVETPLSRHQVVATKAATQALSHGLKVGYFAPLLASGELDARWLVPAAAAAVAGTTLGTRLLERWSEAGFRRVSRWVVAGLGALFLARGLAALAA